MKKFLHNQKGSVMIIVAVGMAVFMGMAAMSIDIGRAYVTKSDLQKAVDASALAGAQEIAHKLQDKSMLNNTTYDRDTGAGKVVADKVKQYIGLNGFTDGNIESITLLYNDNSDIRGVKVTVNQNVDYMFAKVIGISSGNVKVSATAMCGAIKSMGGALPIGLVNNNTPIVFEPGQNVQLEGSSINPLDYSLPWYGWMHFDNNNPQIYIPGGYTGELAIGDHEEVKMGVDSSAIGNVKTMISGHDSCTWDNHESDCPKVVTILVITTPTGGGGGNQDTIIREFVSVFIDSIQGNGANASISGQYINTIVQGKINPNEEYLNTMGVKLTE